MNRKAKINPIQDSNPTKNEPMKTSIFTTAATCLACACLPAFAHEVKNGSADHTHAITTSDTAVVVATTGQGDFIFEWDEALTKNFPEDAKPFEPRMHGGFTEDADGTIYTGIPGYGLCSISQDLKTWKKLGSDPRLKGTIHGQVFFVHKGKKLLALAQPSDKRILITDLRGEVLQEIGCPTGETFVFEPAKTYYAGEKPNFAVTDVTYLDGVLYAVTGYSPGDFVLTLTESDGNWGWGTLAWGGRGKQPGQFSTAHGIFAHKGDIYVANRAAHQVVHFTKDGKFVKLFAEIPAGNLICNVSYLREHFFFNALSPVAGNKTAAIFAHSGKKLVSTIIPGELGIPVLKNIHHVWPHEIPGENGKKELVLLVHGWNKGKYAVLRQVTGK